MLTDPGREKLAQRASGTWWTILAAGCRAQRPSLGAEATPTCGLDACSCALVWQQVKC